MDKDVPIRDPLHQVGDTVMGFAMHYPVCGKIKDRKWNIVNLEWEYFIENDDGFDGKIKENKILKFDDNVWKQVKSYWDEYLRLMNSAHEIEKNCRKLLSTGYNKNKK